MNRLLVIVFALFSLLCGVAQAQSLSASPSTVYVGQAVTATWSGIGAPTSTDWIGLYPVGAADNAFVAWTYTDGNASGSTNLAVPANTAAGNYELRLFSNNGYTLLAASNSFSVQTPSGNISASPATVYSGQAVTATWSAISAPTAQDWVGLFAAGAADNAFVAFIYTNGSASGSGPLTVPPNTAAGTYELRLFTSNGYQRLGTSNSFSVQTPTGNLSASPATVYTGQAVTAAWSAISAPTSSDWIGLYPSGAADNAFVAFAYTDGNAAGSTNITVPPNTAAGTYELRLFTNNGYQRLGTSNSFAVQAQPPATLSVNPGNVPPGGQITATWTNIVAPTATDWIGLYSPNGADNAFISWRYTHGSTAGNVPFSIPANLANGTYQLRLFSNNGYARLATSANFSVGNQLSLYFIHPDHLNTPRLVADANQQTVWKWDQQEPFGNSPADENPSSLGNFELPLRLPGQRYDAETALHYNYYRDYDQSLGIYKQSDPVGLRTGLNTYSYVLGNPVTYVDPFGLEVTRWSRPADIGPYGIVGKAVDHHWLKTDKYESGMGPGNGQVPAQEGRSDYFGEPVITVDHTGQSKAPNARQITIPFPVDEECVNSFIRPGQSLGQFSPSNQCQAFSEEILSRCRIDPALNRPRGWTSGPIRRR